MRTDSSGVRGRPLRPRSGEGSPALLATGLPPSAACGAAVRACDAWTVFERFTERARRVIVLAQQAAAELGHAYIGTEHLLLALCREQ